MSKDIDITIDLDLMRKRIKEERKRKKITQQDIADKTGYSLTTIGNIERGDTKSPDIESISRIASALNCSIDYLCGKVDFSNYDNHFAHEYTGLTEAAIEKLHHDLQDEKIDDNHFLTNFPKRDILSRLITETDLIAKIVDYCQLKSTESDVVTLEFSDRVIKNHSVINGTPHNVNIPNYASGDMKINGLDIGRPLFKEAVLRLVQNELEKL